MTPIENELWVAIERTRRESDRLQRTADRELERLVLNQLEYRDRDPTHVEDVRRHLWRAAELHDASEFLQKRLLEAADSWCVDEPLPRSRHPDDLQGFVDTLNIPREGVYVAWDAQPVSFLYVGLAGSRRWLFDGDDGELLDALQDAERFAALLPSPSQQLEALEGSLLLVIQHHQGELPVNTRVPGFVAPGEAADRLERLSAAIKWIGDQIRRPE